MTVIYNAKKLPLDQTELTQIGEKCDVFNFQKAENKPENPEQNVEKGQLHSRQDDQLILQNVFENGRAQVQVHDD